MADTDRFVALAFCRADLVLELDVASRVVFAAGASVPLLGVLPEQLKGRSFSDIIASSDRQLATEMLTAARDRGRIDDVLLRLNGINNATPLVALGGYRVPDFEDHIFLALKSNPTAHIRRPDDGRRDPDSGLMDEASFVAAAAERVPALRSAAGRPQVTTVKIDGMEDLLRHLGASDRRRLLATIGEILATSSLGGNTAGRVGPDSFGYVHSEAVDPDEVNSTITATAKRDFNADIRPTGHTLDADGAAMSEEQVARAIAHTIRAFSEHGDHSRKKEDFSKTLKGKVNETIDTIAYLRRVVEQRDFDITFMPVCDMQIHCVHHFEALTRFRNPSVTTSTFQLFCLAEEVGIIAELDIAICEAVIRAVIAYGAGPGPMPAVAINLSAMSIVDPVFVERLKKLLLVARVPPNKLMFEITESARISQIVKANEVIQDFRKAGFRFCLDDFGSGAASFDYLNALDVDIVKFDGPVTQRACASRKGSDLLGSMAKMCATMGVRTCAEMVEDKTMAAKVHQCGIDFGQGWYFGRPEADPFEFSQRFVGA